MSSEVVIRPSHVTALHKRLSSKYGSVLVTSATKDTLKTVSDALTTMGVANVNAHLKTYAFTLGQLIYYPFDVENPQELPGWSFKWQLITAAHEHYHVLDAKRLGFENFAKDYVLSSEARAVRYEAPAYCIAAELMPHLYGEHPDPHELVSPLQAYGCTEREIFDAGEIVRLRQVAIRLGAELSDPAKETLSFLRQAQVIR